MIWTLPALASFLYAVGQMDLKKALEQGATAPRVTATSNAALILWTLPLVFLLPGQWSAPGLAGAVLSGAFLFTGRIFMVRALDTGDLSVVAPILATKTVLVGLFSWWTGSGVTSPTLLAAAALASAGMALLNRGPSAGRGARWSAMGLAFLASVLFALSDVVTQGYARMLGAGWYLPSMAATVFLLYPFLGPRAPAPAAARPSLLRGSAIMGFQTSLIVLLIGLTGQGTLINIIYSTRSLWSVLVDSWEGRSEARAYMGWRLAGALLLTAAVVVALWK